MKSALLIMIHMAVAVALLAAACSEGPNARLRGTWKSDVGTKVKITNARLIMDNDLAEQYTLKGDTILASPDGDQPYTRFVIQRLDDHRMTLMYPDSVAIEFVR